MGTQACWSFPRIVLAWACHLDHLEDFPLTLPVALGFGEDNGLRVKEKSDPKCFSSAASPTVL